MNQTADIKTPREKYFKDLEYHALVDTLVAFINQAKYTPSEIREACILASIIYEERRIHTQEVRASMMPEDVEEALFVLNDWTEGKSPRELTEDRKLEKKFTW